MPIDETSLARLDAIWENHGDPEAWNFVTAYLRNGDLYLGLTLLRTFRERKGGGRRIRFLAVTRAHAGILSLFADAIDEIVLVPDFNLGDRNVAEWRVRRGQLALAPGTLITLNLTTYTYETFNWNAAAVLLSHANVRFIDLQKLILGLPITAAPALPRITDEARAAAQDLLDREGLVPGRTLILFPYAQSLVQDSATHFEELARVAAAAGLLVRTSVSPGEPVIEGTQGIFIPFNVLIPFCELAGHTVAVRSGINDILSSARCRNVSIYASAEERDIHSPHAFGLGGATLDFVWNFVVGSHPRQFAARVSRELLDPTGIAGSRLLPRTVLDWLRLTYEPPEKHFRFQTRDVLVSLGQYRLFPNAVMAEGWWPSEPWGTWSAGERSLLYLKPAAALMDLAGRDSGAGTVYLALDMVFSISENTHERLLYRIEINGETIECEARWPEGRGIVRVPLRQQDLAEPLRVTFLIANPSSPHAQSNGQSDDSRLMGIGLLHAWYELEARF